MNILYRKAQKEDADLLIQIYNESFYDDFIRYGECPAYGGPGNVWRNPLSYSLSI